MLHAILPPARLCLALVASTFLIAAGPAAAGPLRASASLTSDPLGVVPDEQPSGMARAEYGSPVPVVTATATRRHLVIDSQAAGHSPGFADKYGGAADVNTNYTLWNLAENRALTDAEAAPYRLSFNFNLSGLTTTSGDSHERSVGLAGRLSYQAFPFAVAFGDHGSYTQDPNSLVTNGNQALMNGVVDADYSLVHQGVASGVVGFELQASAAIGATVFYDLWLESVTLIEDLFAPSVQSLMSAIPASDSITAPSTFDLGMGLGVKLIDGGDLLVVVPSTLPPGTLPTPPSLALVVGALAFLRWRRPVRG